MLFRSIEEVETVVLRGNVNTRVQKLCDDEFDAVVLALPGLERSKFRKIKIRIGKIN